MSAPGMHVQACSVAVVSSVVVMSSHLITNRMRFYFFQSKCVVNVSSACHFPTRGGMQCKIVRLSLSFPRSKFENFMGYSCFMGLSLMPFGTLRIVERLIGKISAQPHTTLCIQFLDRENNDKNNTLPLGKQTCFTIVWGYAETLPINILVAFLSAKYQ